MLTDDVLAAATDLFALDPDQIRCPYPTFAALREQAPVVWFDELDSFVVTDYDLIVDILKQPERFSSRHATGRAAEIELMGTMAELAAEDPEILALATQAMEEGGPAPVLLSADPPAHPRQRALVNRAFSPGAIRRLEPEIDRVARELVDGFADRGSADICAELAGPLPMIVIANALGVPLDRIDDFTRWSRTIAGAIGNSNLGKAELADLFKARTALSSYLLSVVRERTEAPQDDLISQIVQSEIDGERLTANEVVSMAIQFLLAGNHTTATVLGSSVLRLAQDPELAELLRKDESLIPTFAEEALRFEPPINGTYRIADEACTLGGVEIPADSSLWLVYAAANRDPRHFEQPDVCQHDRQQESPHLTFGFGAHYCLGAALARAEIRIGLRALLERCHDLRLAIDPSEIPYDASFMLHGLGRLPVAFTPAGS
jgi:cytochrome P450